MVSLVHWVVDSGSSSRSTMLTPSWISMMNPVMGSPPVGATRSACTRQLSESTATERAVPSGGGGASSGRSVVPETMVTSVLWVPPTPMAWMPQK